LQEATSTKPVSPADVKSTDEILDTPIKIKKPLESKPTNGASSTNSIDNSNL
jgi:hypothetical protein